MGGGSEHWEWIDRRRLQKLGGAAMEADGSMLETGASEQNRRHLLTTLLRPVETTLEIYPLKL